MDLGKDAGVSEVSWEEFVFIRVSGDESRPKE